jgi:hypothetical protein
VDRRVGDVADVKVEVAVPFIRAFIGFDVVLQFEAVSQLLLHPQSRPSKSMAVESMLVSHCRSWMPRVAELSRRP